MTTPARWIWLAFATTLPIMVGCTVYHTKAAADVCIAIPDSYPPGIYVGQSINDAIRILGEPLKETDGDGIGGTYSQSFEYPSVRILLSSSIGDVVGSIAWLKAGSGPNSELVLGKTPLTAAGNLVKYDGDDFTVIAVCQKPHFRQMRVVYHLKDGKIDSIHIQSTGLPIDL